MRARWIPLAACLALAAPAFVVAQEPPGDGDAVEIDEKWIAKWKAKWKLSDDAVRKFLDDVAKSDLIRISAAYARDMASDEPKARREAMAKLTLHAVAAPSEQEARGAIRMLERFGALKEERAGAPEIFAGIAGRLAVGPRRTVAVGAWIRAWCAAGKYDQARAVLAAQRTAYGTQAPLLAALDETIRVAEVRAGLAPGGTAPRLAGTAFGGTPVDTAQWRGAPVVVWFWSPDDKASVVRLPEMNALAEQFGAQGVQWLGVAVARDGAASKQFVQDNGMEWPQLCESGGYGAPPVRAWAVERVQRLWVLDRKGVVRGVDVPDGKALRALLTTLLAEKSD